MLPPITAKYVIPSNYDTKLTVHVGGAAFQKVSVRVNGTWWRDLVGNSGKLLDVSFLPTQPTEFEVIIENNFGSGIWRPSDCIVDAGKLPLHDTHYWHVRGEDGGDNGYLDAIVRISWNVPIPNATKDAAWKVIDGEIAKVVPVTPA